MNNYMRLCLNGYKDKALVGFPDSITGLITNGKDVTEDFLNCVVRYCSEEVEFELDGMRFKATCERID